METPNIGPGECRVRLILGAVFLAAAVGILVALHAVGAGRVWRAGLFMPFWLGTLGILQCARKT